MSKKLNSLGYVAVGYGALVTLCLQTYAAGGLEELAYLLQNSDPILLVVVFFQIWALLPFALLFLILKQATSCRVIVSATISSILLFLSTYLYYESVVLYPDPQGGLVSVFLPLYQVLTIAACFGSVEIISVLRKKFTS